MKDQPTCQTCGGDRTVPAPCTDPGLYGKNVSCLVHHTKPCPDCTGKQPEAEVIVGNATAMKILEMDVPAHPTSEREKKRLTPRAEKELLRLASLVGTDSKTAEEKFLAAIEQMLADVEAKAELLLREAREEAAHISNYYCDFCNNKMTNAELESHSG